MFKIHKSQLSGSIHSGHFMVSRLDDDDEDDENHEAGDDSSESERDNANSLEIDVNNPDSDADANNLNIPYQVDDPSTKNEHLASWNDLDRPAKHPHKQKQYLTYYTNSNSNFNSTPEDIGASNGQQTNNNNNNGASTGRSVAAAHSGSSSSTPSPLLPIMPTTSGNPGGVLFDANSLALNSQISALNHHHKGSILSRAALFNSPASLSSPSSTVAASTSFVASSRFNPNMPVTSASTVGTFNNEMIDRDYLTKGINLCQNQIQTIVSSHHSISSHVLHGHAHAVTIDTSLTKLLEWMASYYSSKLTSPKWKSFKGLKLRLKCKIRLNNLIWRAWFLQCIRGRRPPGCQFTAPVETDVHKKSETIVLEGKYWKRREKAIVDEYKKWRIFHKQKSQTHCFRPVSILKLEQVYRTSRDHLNTETNHQCYLFVSMINLPASQ